VASVADDEDEGMIVARIRIQRRMMPDGADVVIAEFDDGHDDGDIPAAVELLGMLEMSKDSVLHGGIYDDDGDDDG
jgi:hypothetical protein